MIFTTRAEWEIKDPVLKKLGQDESERTYPFIKVELNIPLYRVDIITRDSEDEDKIKIGHHFIMHDIEHVKSLVKQKEVLDYDIYLETPRDINRKDVQRHKVKKLSKIVHGKDKNSCDVEAYIFADEDNYINGEVNSIEDIRGAEVIFDIEELNKSSKNV